MKGPRHYLALFLSLLFLAAGPLGCATTKDVERIVAQSNAAMIAAPPLDKAGIASSDIWRDAVGQMDRIITENPDQTTLVCHLRVRQAMLLTVYQQDNLAEQRWQMVKDCKLTSERDQILYANRDLLVWWYKRAANPDIFDTLEKTTARDFITDLGTSIDTSDNHELRIFLATLRAQIALKLVGSADPQTVAELAELHADMTAHLAVYVNVFTQEEQAWVKANPNTNIADYLSITEIRNRVWLRSLIKAYFKIARDYRQVAVGFGLPELPEWEPVWIRTLGFNP